MALFYAILQRNVVRIFARAMIWASVFGAKLAETGEERE